MRHEHLSETRRLGRRQVGHIRAPDRDADGGQVHDVGHGQIHGNLARFELPLEGVQRSEAVSGLEQRGQQIQQRVEAGGADVVGPVPGQVAGGSGTGQRRPRQREHLQPLGLGVLGGAGDEELDGRTPAALPTAHEIQGQADHLAVAMHRHPGGHRVDGSALVDGEQQSRVVVVDLIQAAEREAHLGQGLLPDPALRDRANLITAPLRGGAPRGPLRGDALAARVVEGGAHVLERLALESEIGQVDDGLLCDLQNRPPLLAGGEHGGLVHGVQGGHQSGIGGEGGEALDRGLGPLGSGGDGVPQRQGDPGSGAVGEAGAPVIGDPRLVAGPAEHPAQRAGAARPHQGHEVLVVDAGGDRGLGQGRPGAHDGDAPGEDREEPGGEAREGAYRLERRREDQALGGGRQEPHEEVDSQVHGRGDGLEAPSHGHAQAHAGHRADEGADRPGPDRLAHDPGTGVQPQVFAVPHDQQHDAEIEHDRHGDVVGLAPGAG